MANYLHAACAIGSDIYVFGGKFGLEGRQTSVFKYSTETDIWSTLEPMPLPCYSHSVSVLDGDQVCIVGAGHDGEGVLRFDMASGMWSALGATLISKHGGLVLHRSATFVLGGCLYVAGGQGDSSSIVERYDFATDTWTAVAKMFEGRSDFCAVTIGSTAQDLFGSLITIAVRERISYGKLNQLLIYNIPAWYFFIINSTFAPTFLLDAILIT
jgi:hypothetical protein